MNEIEVKNIGGMLTKSQIIEDVKSGFIDIDPYDESRVNPNSYNLRLHPKLLVYSEDLDMKKESKTKELIIPEEGLVLKPGVLYIGRTVEKTSTSKYIPMINGRSSIGRLGISIHICAGFGDIGFDGTWTLEISVVEPVRVYPNVEIAQVCFFTPYGYIRNEDLYNGKYLGQIEPTPSRLFTEKEKYENE